MRYRLLTFGLALAAASAAAQPQLSVEQRLERLERRAASITDLTLKLQALQQENQELRGRLEVLQHQMQGLERKQRDLYLDVDQRLSALQAAPAKAPSAAVAAPTPAEPAASPAAPEQPTSAPVDPVAEKAAYDAASDLLQQRRYQEAIKGFDQFLADFPNGELAPNARYWLAEAYYVTNQNDQALEAFRAVVATAPQSAKARGAWLKIGYLLHAQGQRDEARRILKQVIDDYPGSAEAGMARQRLDRIASEGR